MTLSIEKNIEKKINIDSISEKNFLIDTLTTNNAMYCDWLTLKVARCIRERYIGKYLSDFKGRLQDIIIIILFNI